jgi:hypothetical protein
LSSYGAVGQRRANTDRSLNVRSAC